MLLAASTELPAGVQISQGVEVRAGAVSFETIAETYVWPLECVGVGKLPAPATDGNQAEDDRREDAKARVGLTPSASADFYVTDAAVRRPDRTGRGQHRRRSQSLDHSLWIAVLGKAGTDVRALADQSLFVGIAFDEQLPLPFALQSPGQMPSSSARRG